MRNSWHTRPRVQRAPGIPCALCSQRGNEFGKARANHAARTIFVVPDKRATRAPIRDPYAAAEIICRRWWTALLKRLRPVAVVPAPVRNCAPSRDDMRERPLPRRLRRLAPAVGGGLIGHARVVRAIGQARERL